MCLGKVRAVGAGGGRGAAMHTEALEDLSDVILRRVEAAIQDGGDLLIGLALRDPMQYLPLTGCQV